MTKRIEKFKYLSASCILVVNESSALVANVYSQTRHEGHATGLMKLVTEFADKNDLTLNLRAQAYGHPVMTILDNEALTKFYEKWGFVKEHDRQMTRTSRKLHTI